MHLLGNFSGCEYGEVDGLKVVGKKMGIKDGATGAKWEVRLENRDQNFFFL